MENSKRFELINSTTATLEKHLKLFGLVKVNAGAGAKNDFTRGGNNAIAYYANAGAGKTADEQKKATLINNGKHSERTWLFAVNDKLVVWTGANTTLYKVLKGNKAVQQRFCLEYGAFTQAVLEYVKTQASTTQNSKQASKQASTTQNSKQAGTKRKQASKKEDKTA